MRPTKSLVLHISLLTLALWLLGSAASAQTMEILSRTPGGGSPNGRCYGKPALTPDGRYVAFNSDATDLVPAPGGPGTFVLDRSTQAIERISVNVGGPGTGGGSWVGDISDDGRYVVFFGDGIMPADWNDYGSDILVRDRVSGTTSELTSQEFQGTQKSIPEMTGDGQHVCWWEFNGWFPPSSLTSLVVKQRTGATIGTRGANQGGPLTDRIDSPRLAAGGGYVAYTYRDPSGTYVKLWNYLQPTSTDVVLVSAPSASNEYVDAAAISRDARFVAYTRRTSSTFEIWLHDAQTGLDERVDVPVAAGTSSSCQVGSISGDGRYVVFHSDSPGLVVGDTNLWPDVFVRDREIQRTARVSVSVAGAQSNGLSMFGVLDESNGAVAFLTEATNLASGDGNTFADVYRRSTCTATYLDGDGDGYGTGSALFSCAPPPSNHVSVGGDCDDANPARHPNAVEACNGIDDDCDALIDEDIASTPFCFGDGGGTACPCGNAGAAGRGCASSVDPSGALLRTLGCASLSSDTLVLAGSSMPNAFALYFQGDARANGGAGVAFGDGLRCVAGATVRLGSKSNAAGGSQYPAVGDASISVRGAVSVPGLRYYQTWYRNAAAFCTSATFNLTNGVSVPWGS